MQLLSSDHTEGDGAEVEGRRRDGGKQMKNYRGRKRKRMRGIIRRKDGGKTRRREGEEEEGEEGRGANPAMISLIPH